MPGCVTECAVHCALGACGLNQLQYVCSSWLSAAPWCSSHMAHAPSAWGALSTRLEQPLCPLPPPCSSFSARCAAQGTARTRAAAAPTAPSPRTHAGALHRWAWIGSQHACGWAQWLAGCGQWPPLGLVAGGRCCSPAPHLSMEQGEQPCRCTHSRAAPCPCLVSVHLPPQLPISPTVAAPAD